MHIVIKRVYESVSDEDGVRVLVDRLWPRGLSKAAAAIDHWPRELAPSDDLRRWYGHDPQKFAAFQSRYQKELDAQKPEVKAFLESIDARRRLTLLTATKEVSISHAVVLQAYLKQVK